MAIIMISSTQWAVALAIVFLALWWGSSSSHQDLRSNRHPRETGRWLSSWFVDEREKTAGRRDDDDSSSPNSPSPSLTTIYAIGDLHGDVECARQWVARTNVLKKVDKENNNGEAAVWRDEQTRLVFMGDYLDKGITSKQTVEYVKSLTEQFPDFVTAILGNHEIELLRDRTESLWGGGRAGYYQLSYGAVHPADYLEYLSASQYNNDDVDDAIVVDALYNASLSVYGMGRHRSVFFTTKSDDNNDDPGSILSYISNTTLRATVRERLKLYQRAYLDTYRTGTVLGDWLETRPIAAVVDTTLFVHGGLAPNAATQYLSTVDAVEKLNDMWRRHASEEKLGTFLTGTTAGQLVYHLATFRGNHKNCRDLVLPVPLKRLAVGHTPGKMVRDPCGNGQFLALDSSLSRWFRNSGNQYCQGDSVRPSSSGDYICPRKNNECQGQIVRIRGDQVEILSMTATAAE
jgi:hypothetical protein